MRYRGGIDTLLNALDADRDLFSAELSLAQTGRGELLALVQLYKPWAGAGSNKKPTLFRHQGLTVKNDYPQTRAISSK